MYVLDQDRYENRIIPVLLKPCSTEALSWTLASLQRVDFSGGFERSCRELLKIWGIR